MSIPVPRGTTLRQLAAQNNWNIDWDRLNQSGNDDGNAYRRQIFDMITQQYNPYGTSGATFLDPMGRAGEVDVSIIPDDLSGQWGDIARRLGAQDAPTLRGMLARGRGNELFRGDRGMYNEYAADLGNLIYDQQLGFLPGEGGFQEGSRVGQSFRNMQTWGPAAVLAVGALGNMGMLGGGSGGSSGLLGSGPPPIEGAPSLLGGGQSAASAAAQQALPGMAQAGVTVGGGGAMVPGMSYGMGGAAGGGLLGGGGGGAGEAATGAFDTGGWQGTGINGATGTRDFGSAMSNAFNRYTMQAGNNIGNFFNDPLGTMARNPLNTIRAINGIYSVGSSLMGPRGPSGGSQGGGDGSKGGSGQSMNVPQGQFTPNQFTMAQLANLYGR